MLRCLVLLGIADGAECMLGLERNSPQRVAGEGNRAIGEIAPIAVAPIMEASRMIQNEPGAFESDEAIRELVLDRLEFSDRLPELAALFGVVHGQIERTSGGTMCARHQRQPCRETDITERDSVQGKERQRCRSQPDLAETPSTHGARRRDFHAKPIHSHERKGPLIDSDEKMGHLSRRFDETKHTRSAQAVNPDCTHVGVRSRGRCISFRYWARTGSVNTLLAAMPSTSTPDFEPPGGKRRKK